MNITFNREKDNFTKMLQLMIQKLKIPVSSLTIEKDMANHPQYPSLLSVSDCLTKWKIPHESFKIQKDNVDITQLPYPFIAHINEKDGQLIFVKKILSGKVHYYNDNRKKNQISVEKFLQIWSGVILYAEKDHESGEADYLTSRVTNFINNTSIPSLIVLILSLIFLSQYQELSMNAILAITVVKAIGVVISSLLLLTTIDKDNPFVHQLCSLSGKGKCSTVLESSYAQILPWITLSEISWFYFSGSLLCIILDKQSFGLLRLLNLISLPMIIYSIFFQIRLKEWCLLCCLIITILVAECICFNFDKSLLRIDLNPINWLRTAASLLLPAAIWFSLKPLMVSHFGLPELTKQLKIFKNNKNLFETYLEKGKTIEIEQDLPLVSFGSSKPKTIVTMISNPFCKPCSDAHHQVEQLLLQRDDVRVQIIFATGLDTNASRIEVARHLIALYQKEDQALSFQALSEWYQKKFANYEAFAKHYPIDRDDEDDQIVALHQKWCSDARIQFTPTILINNHVLEHPYQISDLTYLLS